MESEEELHLEIQQLSVAATVPSAYKGLIDVGLAGTLVALAAHDNTGAVPGRLPATFAPDKLLGRHCWNDLARAARNDRQ
jgi:hypothetical protein